MPLGRNAHLSVSVRNKRYYRCATLQSLSCSLTLFNYCNNETNTNFASHLQFALILHNRLRNCDFKSYANNNNIVRQHCIQFVHE